MMNAEGKDIKDIQGKLVIVRRDKLQIQVPDEKTLLRLVINLEAQPREYFIVEA